MLSTCLYPPPLFIGVMLPVLFNVCPRVSAPVVTVMGAPITYRRRGGDDSCDCPQQGEREPTEAEVDEFMKLYVAELTKLYNTYAPIYNSAPRSLIIT